jgi:predicted Na+-dependent transporter
MLNFLSGISLFLMSLLAYAADQPGPVDTSVSASDEIGIIIFVIIFFGLIVGYFAYLYWGKKEPKDGDEAQNK